MVVLATDYLTYTTLDGEVYDLSALTDEERAFFDHCYEAYSTGSLWREFQSLMNGRTNPLVRGTDGWVTRAVWNHPLYQAVRDLGDRLAILQGALASEPGDDPSTDPLRDEWLPVSEAASRKNVSPQALHGAIKRKAVLAKPVRPGASRLVISSNSLRRWKPSKPHQASGRKRAASA